MWKKIIHNPLSESDSTDTAKYFQKKRYVKICLIGDDDDDDVYIGWTIISLIMAEITQQNYFTENATPVKK